MLAHIQRSIDCDLAEDNPLIHFWKDKGEDYVKEKIAQAERYRDVFLPFLEQNAKLTPQDEKLFFERMTAEKERKQSEEKISQKTVANSSETGYNALKREIGGGTQTAEKTNKETEEAFYDAEKEIYLQGNRAGNAARELHENGDGDGNHLHQGTGWGLLSARPDNGRGGRRAAWQIRDEAQGLAGGISSSAVHSNAADGRVAAALSGSAGESLGDERAADKANGAAAGIDRGDEKQRAAQMGGSYEQHIQRSGGNNPLGSDIQSLSENKIPGQKAEEMKTSAFAFAQKGKLQAFDLQEITSTCFSMRISPLLSAAQSLGR